MNLKFIIEIEMPNRDEDEEFNSLNKQAQKTIKEFHKEKISSILNGMGITNPWRKLDKDARINILNI